jgi:hypothetical protein
MVRRKYLYDIVFFVFVFFNVIKKKKNLYLFIYILIGIPIPQQGLAYKGTRLENDKMISNYGIEKGGVIDLVNPSSIIQITVKTKGDKKIPLEVSTEDTIRNLKEQLEEEESI